MTEKKNGILAPVVISISALLLVIGVLVVSPPHASPALSGKYDAGVTEVATEPTSHPNEYVDGDELSGLSPDDACASYVGVLCDRLVECGGYDSDEACHERMRTDGMCSDVKNTAAEIMACADAVTEMSCDAADPTPEACSVLK